MQDRMRFSNSRGSWILLLFLVCSVAGCGGGGGGGGSSTPPVVYEPNYINSLESLNHWSFLPVKIYFALPAEWAAVYPADLHVTATLSWNQASKQAFLSVVGTQAEADVVCSFVDTPPAEWSSNTIAITRYSVDTSRHLMVPGTVSVTCAMRDRTGRSLGAQQMQTAIAHELGHVLGISGHSPNTDDLLYPTQQPGILTPQTRDLNTAMTAYPTYFGAIASRINLPETPDPAFIEHREIH
jgi:hypothetical protein